MFKDEAVPSTRRGFEQFRFRRRGDRSVDRQYTQLCSLLGVKNYLPQERFSYTCKYDLREQLFPCQLGSNH